METRVHLWRFRGPVAQWCNRPRQVKQNTSYVGLFSVFYGKIHIHSFHWKLECILEGFVVQTGAIVYDVWSRTLPTWGCSLCSTVTYSFSNGSSSASLKIQVLCYSGTIVPDGSSRTLPTLDCSLCSTVIYRVFRMEARVHFWRFRFCVIVVQSSQLKNVGYAR